MDDSAGLGLFIILIGILIYAFPVLHIISSSKVRGGEKVAWLIAVLFISWFAYIFFLLLAPLKNG